MQSINNRKIFLLFTFFLFFSCSRNSTEPEAQPFTLVLHNGLTETETSPVCEKLENNYERILYTLKVNSMPDVTIEFWNDLDDYQEAMEVSLGYVDISATTFNTGGNIIHLLFTKDSPKAALHEFAHLVTLEVNPTLPDNPRWLWEATATYFANQFVHPSSTKTSMLGQYTSICNVNVGLHMYYYLIHLYGYVLIEYIYETWGSDGLLLLIQNNGSIDQTFGISIEEFEEGWHRFIDTSYLL